MSLLLGTILLAAVILLAIWLSQNWAMLTGQFRTLMGRPPAGQVVPPEGTVPAPAQSTAPASPSGHNHGPHDKRHTVLPHQARGR